MAALLRPGPTVFPLVRGPRHAVSGRAAGGADRIQPLKDGVWSLLNSYVHSGIHPIVQQRIGYSPDFALATLQNSNGLTGMAALLAAELSGDQEQVLRILNAQYAHLDCLPPAKPNPAPPLEPHANALG